MKYPKQANPRIQKVDWWLPGAGANGEWRETATVYDVSFGWGDETVLKLDGGDGCTKLKTPFGVNLWYVNDISKKIIKNVTHLQLIFITVITGIELLRVKFKEKKLVSKLHLKCNKTDTSRPITSMHDSRLPASQPLIGLFQMTEMKRDLWNKIYGKELFVGHISSSLNL